MCWHGLAIVILHLDCLKGHLIDQALASLQLGGRRDLLPQLSLQEAFAGQRRLLGFDVIRLPQLLNLLAGVTRAVVLGMGVLVHLGDCC